MNCCAKTAGASSDATTKRYRPRVTHLHINPTLQPRRCPCMLERNVALLTAIHLCFDGVYTNGGDFFKYQRFPDPRDHPPGSPENPAVRPPDTAAFEQIALGKDRG